MAIINGLNIETTHIKDIKVGDIVLFHGVEKLSLQRISKRILSWVELSSVTLIA
ncbi:hypothetical protein [Salmonella phage SWJM-02]|uniref:Uncharacterized protein n=1 Tax=Salmonella phage SWJM-02 TaxID=3034862 RepID=A0AAF0D0K1_9CAUD|nr:hypothetical protein [Salmonella phage SWJM-02]